MMNKKYPSIEHIINLVNEATADFKELGSELELIVAKGEVGLLSEADINKIHDISNKIYDKYFRKNETKNKWW